MEKTTRLPATPELVEFHRQRTAGRSAQAASPLPRPSRAGDPQVGSHGQSPYDLDQVPKRLTLLPCVTRPPDRQRDGPASGDARGLLEAGQGGADDRSAGGGGAWSRMRSSFFKDSASKLSEVSQLLSKRAGLSGPVRTASAHDANTSSRHQVRVSSTPKLDGGHE